MARRSTEGADTAAESICAVVVTRNHPEQLAACLTAIFAQSRAPDAVLVVDNASDDETTELLATRFGDAEVLVLPRDEGVAGGFHEGIRVVHERGHDYVWLVEDDVVADSAALANLVEAWHESTDETSFVASKVLSEQGGVDPTTPLLLSWRNTELLIDNVAAHTGMLPVRATSFASVLLAGATIERHGLPEKKYFDGAGAIEYTARTTAEGDAFIATASVVVRKRRGPAPPRVDGDRSYFGMRNTVFMLRGDSWTALEKVSLLRDRLRLLMATLRQNGYSQATVAGAIRGVAHGLLPPADPAGPYRPAR